VFRKRLMCLVLSFATQKNGKEVRKCIFEDNKKKTLFRDEKKNEQIQRIHAHTHKTIVQLPATRG